MESAVSPMNLCTAAKLKPSSYKVLHAYNGIILFSQASILKSYCFFIEV